MEKFCRVLFAFVMINVGLSNGKHCKEPPTATGYENQKYEGIWYEIGKVDIFYCEYCIVLSIACNIQFLVNRSFFSKLSLNSLYSDPNSRRSILSARFYMYYCNI